MTIWVEVEADHHQFYLSPIEEDPTTASVASTVFDVGRRHVVVRTGVAMGPVAVGLSLLADPPALDFDGWDDVAQATLEIVEPLRFISLNGEVADDLDAVEPPPSRIVCIRVSARGRASNWDEVVDSPTEHYLFEIWPADALAQPEQLKSSDGASIAPPDAALSALVDPSGSGTEDATARLFGPTKMWVDDDDVWHTEQGAGGRRG